ncbi:MAG: hypothetical protein LWW86_11140 [Micrococcales bacterium]|nr:hypothetical protein [Micrococcales bacterium]
MPTGPYAASSRPAARDALVALARERGPRCGETLVVAVDGPSGAGKTAFAAMLAEHLGAGTVHMDDLYAGWDGLEGSSRRLVGDVLEPLARGEHTAYRRWDWETGELGGLAMLGRPSSLVVEGCGAGATPVREWLSALAWVDADPATRRARALEREPGFEPYWERWAQGEREHFPLHRTREHADVALSTTDWPEPR